MKNRAQTHRRPWFLWIGGACFLVGSILFSTIGFASSAGPPNQTVTANQGTAGASPWPVSASISGSLPAGSSDIGTVHVAAPTPYSGQAECTVPDGSSVCVTSLGGLPSSGVINTLSVQCFVASGQRVTLYYTDGSSPFYVPLTLQQSLTGFDVYEGTLTSLGLPLPVYENVFQAQQDYNASSGNGSDCTLSYTGTSS
jgi:hypothetical protein